MRAPTSSGPRDQGPRAPSHRFGTRRRSSLLKGYGPYQRKLLREIAINIGSRHFPGSPPGRIEFPALPAPSPPRRGGGDFRDGHVRVRPRSSDTSGQTLKLLCPCLPASLSYLFYLEPFWYEGYLWCLRPATSVALLFFIIVFLHGPNLYGEA